jgi:hypothetical protein
MLKDGVTMSFTVAKPQKIMELPQGKRAVLGGFGDRPEAAFFALVGDGESRIATEGTDATPISGN